MAAYTAAYGHPLDHPGDSGRGERRWGTSRRVVAAASVVLVLVTGAVVLGTLGGTTTVLPLGDGPAAGGQVEGGPGDAPVDGASTAAPAAGDPRAPQPVGVVVHVVGEVHAPGLVELAAGARVSDAIEAAGGPTAEAELSALNLARSVADGEQVVVPAAGEVPLPGEAPGPGQGGGAAGPMVVDLNAADASALDALPGIGPVLAERIVAWRAEHGRFSTVDELTEVSGIGPAVLESVRDLVRV